MPVILREHARRPLIHLVILDGRRFRCLRVHLEVFPAIVDGFQFIIDHSKKVESSEARTTANNLVVNMLQFNYVLAATVSDPRMIRAN